MPRNSAREAKLLSKVFLQHRAQPTCVCTRLNKKLPSLFSTTEIANVISMSISITHLLQVMLLYCQELLPLLAISLTRFRNSSVQI